MTEIYKKYINEYQDFPIDGVNYLDLNPIYKDGQLLKKISEDCVELTKNFNFDYIGIIESRGFILGSIIAHQLGKGCVLLRSKRNRLPGKTYTVSHKLEYGESIVEVQRGHGNVLIFDDVLATGGTAKGSIEVLEKAGYTPTSALFLVELDFLNPKLGVPHKSLIHYDE